MKSNKGITLVELLVVIAILSIVVGGSTIGISLAYSRDSERCAKTINDAMENTRMLSLSEKGKFTMTVDFSDNHLTIVRDRDGSTEVVEDIDLQKRVTISVPEASDLTATSIRFDKSTGEVLQMTGEVNGLLRITAENRNGKKASVILVKGTGKHYVEYK